MGTGPLQVSSVLLDEVLPRSCNSRPGKRKDIDPQGTLGHEGGIGWGDVL